MYQNVSLSIFTLNLTTRQAQDNGTTSGRPTTFSFRNDAIFAFDNNLWLYSTRDDAEGDPEELISLYRYNESNPSASTWVRHLPMITTKQNPPQQRNLPRAQSGGWASLPSIPPVTAGRRWEKEIIYQYSRCLLYTSPSPRDS